MYRISKPKLISCAYLVCSKYFSCLGSWLSGSYVRSVNPLLPKLFHTSKPEFWKHDEPLEKQLVIRENLFSKGDKRDKSEFLLVLETYSKSSTIRRQDIEFIYSAMKHLEEYGVQSDIETYKTLMSIFPEGKYVPETRLQAWFSHFPRHQHCAIDLLSKMESYGICPDLEMRDIIIKRFGDFGDVFKKFARMLYWFPKFKHLSPFPLPEKLPNDSLELAKLAISRMMIDLKSSVTIYQAEELPDSLDKTWIVSGQSPLQQELITAQKDNVPFYVEGPFFIWLKQFSITYFVLNVESTRSQAEEEEDPDDISNLEPAMLFPSKVKTLMTSQSIHEQEDGTILGLCATGTSSRDSLLSWIRFLQETNPRLKNNPVLFTLKAPSKDLVTVNQPKNESTT